MIDKFKKTFQQAAETIREQATSLGDSALDRTFSLFEQWAAVLPTLEEYGLKIRSFGINAALSPSMEVFMEGQTEDFNKERLEELLAEHKGSTILTSVFRTMKLTSEIYQKAGAPEYDLLYVRILVKIPPEIKVVYGEPTFL